MEASTIVERDFTALGMLFNLVLNDMKNGTPVWEDFILKAAKLHTQLKSTILASTAFLDSFQKIADMATSTRGGTKDIGSALTRLCLRQRSVESHLKTFTSSIMDCLILPLQDRLEEWKKTNTLLNKEHAKEYKKFRQEMKKRVQRSALENGIQSLASQSQTSTLKLQKKLRLIQNVNSSAQSNFGVTNTNEKLLHFEQLEKNALRRALIEERSRYCLFVSYLKNVMEEELLITQETSHLQEVMENLSKLTMDPYLLPAASELVISDLKLASTSNPLASQQVLNNGKSQPGLSSIQPGHNHQFNQLNRLSQTPPSSPSSFGSRKSSMCSISSFNSSSSGSTHSPSHSHLAHLHLSHHQHNSHSHQHTKYQSISQFNQALPPRIPSITSHDSGFISNVDYNLSQISNQSNISICMIKRNQHCRQVSCVSEESGNTSSSVSMPSSVNWTSNSRSTEKVSTGNVSTEKVEKIANSTNRSIDSGANELYSQPHTISVAYEKNTLRPALTSKTFESVTSCQHKEMCDKNCGQYLTSKTASNKCFESYDWSDPTEKCIPPVPPARKVSLEKSSVSNKNASPTFDCNSLSLSVSNCILDNSSFQKETSCQINDQLILDSNNSEGSITPTNVYQNSGQNSCKNSCQSTCDKFAKASQKENTKLSTSLKSVLFSETAISSQLSLTNLSQNNGHSKPPPPPPIRRTSSISNPNAITLGTLKSAGVSTYEEIKNLNTLKKNTTNYATYEDVSRLGVNNSTNPFLGSSTIYRVGSAKSKDSTNSVYSSGSGYNTFSATTKMCQRNHSCNSLLNAEYDRSDSIYTDIATVKREQTIENDKLDKEKINQLRSEYQQAKHLFENLESNQSSKTNETNQMDSSSGLPLPPPELCHDTDSLSNHHTKICNNRKEFIQTLNAKLAVPQNKTSPKVGKRRSLSLNRENEQTYESTYGTLTTISSSKASSTNDSQNSKLSSQSSQTSMQLNTSQNYCSLPQSLIRLVSSNYAKLSHSSRSPDTSRKNLTNPSSSNNVLSNNHAISVNITGSATVVKIGSEVAKAAASIAAKKKQNHLEGVSSSDDHYTASAFTLSTNDQIVCTSSNFEPHSFNGKNEPIYCSAVNLNASIGSGKNENLFDLNKCGQEIYRPVHNLQMKSNSIRRSSQPTMGLKVATSRQQSTLQCQLQPQQQQHIVYQPVFDSHSSHFQSNTNSQQVQTFVALPKPFQNNNNGNELKFSDDNDKNNFRVKLDTKFSDLQQMSTSQNSSSIVQNQKNNNYIYGHSSNGGFENAIAARVESWLNKGPTDQKATRESLLDQIRKGTQLRKVDSKNDRSAPKI